MVRLSPVGVGVPLALLCGLMAGCGGDNTHQISGKVTFDGKPVPAGKIYFIPDGSKGNSGTTGYAKIVNGEYDTSDTGGKGVISGPLIVAIEGGDPSTQPDLKKSKRAQQGDRGGPVLVDGEEIGTQLFPRFETTFDMPGSDTTKDFDVSSDAVETQQRKQRDQGDVLVP